MERKSREKETEKGREKKEKERKKRDRDILERRVGKERSHPLRLNCETWVQFQFPVLVTLKVHRNESIEFDCEHTFER